jgi:hypothetical protein
MEEIPGIGVSRGISQIHSKGAFHVLIGEKVYPRDLWAESV